MITSYTLIKHLSTLTISPTWRRNMLTSYKQCHIMNMFHWTSKVADGIFRSVLHEYRNEILTYKIVFIDANKLALDVLLSLRLSVARVTFPTNTGSSLFSASWLATCKTRFVLRAILVALETIVGESPILIPSSTRPVSRKIPSSENSDKALH